MTIHTHLYRTNNLAICIHEMKNKKHNRLIKDYEKQKAKHLERLADKILKEDEKLQQWKGKEIDPRFLNLF